MRLPRMDNNMISCPNRMFLPSLVDKHAGTRNYDVVLGLRRMGMIRIVLLAGGNNRQLNIEWVAASSRANVALSSECDGHLAPYDLKRSYRRLPILRLHRRLVCFVHRTFAE